MSRKGLLSLIAIIVVTLFSFVSSQSQKPFIVYVVGDGVPPIDKSLKRETPLNRAQGIAMWDGAFAAYQYSYRLQDIRPYIELKGRDDAGSEDQAVKIAREFQRNPQVIAVIGHATSGTTRQAAWRYAQSLIPLLMPIATSPYVFYAPNSVPTSNNRLRNCFRLPPSDNRIQAPVVAYLASSFSKSKQISLIKDTSPFAIEYSNPLFSEVDRILRAKLMGPFLDNADASGKRFGEIAFGIKGQGSDVVIFCGYGTTANFLFEALRTQYKGVQLHKRPRIIVTDGCLIPNLNTAGFLVDLTFPIAPLSYYTDCTSKDFQILGAAIEESKQKNKDFSYSYQMYGYDAMLLLGEAINQCFKDNSLSRKCVLDKLSAIEQYRGACNAYSFIEGENTLAEYYVYSNYFYNDENDIVLLDSLKFTRALHPDEIFSILLPVESD